MLDPLGDGLDVAKHHGDAGSHADAVRFTHDRQILGCRRLALGDLPSHTIDQNLAAAARNRVQSGLLQSEQHVAQGHVENLMKRPDLRRAEGMNVNAGVFALDEAHQIKVPLERQHLRRHQATLHQDLRSADGQQFFDLVADILETEHVAVRQVLASGVHPRRIGLEIAENALGGAVVRVVDVAIDDVRAAILRVQPLRDAVRPPAELVEVAIRVQRQRVLLANASVAGRGRSRLGCLRQWSHEAACNSCAPGTSPPAVARSKKRIMPSTCLSVRPNVR